MEPHASVSQRQAVNRRITKAKHWIPIAGLGHPRSFTSKCVRGLAFQTADVGQTKRPGMRRPPPATQAGRGKIGGEGGEDKGKHGIPGA